MKKLLPLCLGLALISCKSRTVVTEPQELTAEDTVEVIVCPALDTAINRTAAFYAGISCEGIPMSKSDSLQWTKYSQDVQRLISKSRLTLDPMDTLVAKDMSDIRSKCDYVFYPFSGPDFAYPFTIFPNADTYLFVALEKPGKAPAKAVTSFSKYSAYRHAVTTYLYSSFFITKDMAVDLYNETLDGAVPVISMLMKVMKCSIVSITGKQFSEDGAIVDAEGKARIAEIKFVNDATPSRVQTLYYISTNVSSAYFDKNFQAYLDSELPKHNVASFFKAASYHMHESSFGKIRQNVLDRSFAVIEDDSGIPFRYFKDGWDVTLYGKYIHPGSLFGESVYQPDLEKEYRKSGVRPLGFRIGYNRTSNWLCARKTGSKEQPA